MLIPDRQKLRNYMRVCRCHVSLFQALGLSFFLRSLARHNPQSVDIPAMFLRERASSRSSYYENLISIFVYMLFSFSLILDVAVRFIALCFSLLTLLSGSWKKLTIIEITIWIEKISKPKPKKTKAECWSMCGREILRTNRTTRCYFVFCTLPSHIFLDCSISLAR